MDELDKKRQAAAQLLAIGGIEKSEIARRVGVSRTSLWSWEKEDKMIAEINRLKHEYKVFGKELMESKLVEAVNGYWKLIQSTDNAMVAAKGYEYMIDRSLGKVTNKHEIQASVVPDSHNSKDIIEAENEQWLSEVEEKD
jgi:DNA-binding XRE family transcriptional regulator